MVSWTPGGKDEPLECKQRRESFLQNLPSHVPLKVAEVSRWFLDEGCWQREKELQRILSDERMEGFWGKLRSKVNKHPYIPTGEIATELNWRGIISRCIRLMAFQGGTLPDMSSKVFHNSRLGITGSGVAGEIRRLKKELVKPESAYKNIANLSIFDLVSLCSKSENQELAERGKIGLSELRESNLFLIHAYPNLDDILSALLEQIEKKQPLSLADEWIPTKNIPQLGRKNAQELYFENNFLDLLFQHTQKNCWALTAIAENVVFNLSGGKLVDWRMLYDRRKYK
jgi:hypothetical protein